MAKKCSSERYDRHHLCFYRRNWNKGFVKKLRLYPYCVIKIPQQTIHREIHMSMAGIQPPRDKSAELVLSELKLLEKYGKISENDPIEKRLMILILLFEKSEPKTAWGFRKQLKIIRDYNSRPP